MKKINELLNLVSGMTIEDQKDLVNQILGMMSSSEPKVKMKDSCADMVHEHINEKPDCPHCKAKAAMGYVIKRGFKKSVQRYYCKSCGKFFVATTNTAFSRSRKDAEVWKQFIHLTITGTSIVECAVKCRISVQTAFTWRHKILNVFRVNQSNTKMTGKVELDEMLIPISYKGNHIKGNIGERRVRMVGEDNGLPRESFKRGSDNKSASSRNKACVFCMVENGNKAFYAAVPGVGYMLPKMLDKTVGEHIDKESAFVLADSYKTTRNYLDTNKYKYMTLLSNTSDNPRDHKPEVVGEYHLQHVNAMHRHLRQFLRKYSGVATKYLENYISLYVWIRTMKSAKQNSRIEKFSISRASESDCYITRKSLEMLPAVPMCA